MASAQAGEETNSFEETLPVRGKIRTSAGECFQANDSHISFFYTGNKMAISVQNAMLKVNYFLCCEPLGSSIQNESNVTIESIAQSSTALATNWATARARAHKSSIP